jgi:hypothetical protein
MNDETNACHEPKKGRCGAGAHLPHPLKIRACRTKVDLTFTLSNELSREAGCPVTQTTISHYSILKRLGAGEMGEVYLA